MIILFTYSIEERALQAVDRRGGKISRTGVQEGQGLGERLIMHLCGEQRKRRKSGFQIIPRELWQGRALTPARESILSDDFDDGSFSHCQ